MKSSVSAFIMLMMVLGFVINAFAGNASVETLNSRLLSLIPKQNTGTMAQGQTAGGRYCTLSVDNTKGVASVGIFSGGTMGEGMWSFDLAKTQIGAISDQGSKVEIKYFNNVGEKQILVLEIEGNSLKSAEFLKYKTSFFGNVSLKSEIRCEI